MLDGRVRMGSDVCFFLHWSEQTRRVEMFTVHTRVRRLSQIILLVRLGSEGI